MTGIPCNTLCLPEINRKIPARAKSVEMRKIVSNSEIHLHHCLCESRGFKIGRNNHRRCSKKKAFLKILQNWQKSTCVQVRHGFSTVSFTKCLRTLFYRTLPGDCFWSIGLVVKNFDSMLILSLIFLNSQLYLAPSEWWL